MKRISFFEGLGVALCAAFFSIPISLVTAVIVPGFAMRTTICLAAALYCIFLLSRKEKRTGIFFSSILCTGMVGAVFFFAPTLVTTILGASFVIWLTRSLCYYRSLIPAAVDGFIASSAAVFATWSYTLTGSVCVALWSFFLTHALTAWIPSHLTKRKLVTAQAVDGFQRAHQASEQALAALIAQSSRI